MGVHEGLGDAHVGQVAAGAMFSRRLRVEWWTELFRDGSKRGSSLCAEVVFVGGGAWGCVHGLPVQPETPTAYLPTSRGLASCKKSRREGRSTGLGGFGEARPSCRAFSEAASFVLHDV